MSTIHNASDQTIADKFRQAANRIKQMQLDFMATQPQSIQCEKHPECARRIDQHATDIASNHHGTLTAGYVDCPYCANEKALCAQDMQLRDAGVPHNLLHCHLSNWAPSNETERQHLSSVRAFVKTGRGFLILLGSVGSGKSHLAVGCMRYFKKPLLRKQNALLRELRATYSDRRADDPIRKAQKSDLFVLDELGVSTGGKDEFPMLHDILDYRYGNRLPTVITGNLSTDELKAVLGDRLSDRLRESAFGVLSFAAISHRPDMRSQYFDNKPTCPMLEAGEVLSRFSEDDVEF